MSGFSLTKQADEDLVAIWDYTVAQWGEAQAEYYLRLLDMACHKIARGELHQKKVSTRYPSLYVSKAKYHLIFYLQQNPIIILGFLHEKMDFAVRLRKRLL